MRINLDESVSNIVGELSKWERSFKTESGHEYRGDIFYSDIYSRVKRVTKNTNQGDYIYHGVCEKLRELGFWVHS